MGSPDSSRQSEVLVGAGFLASSAGAVGLATVYWRGGQPQLEGLFLAIALGGFGFGLAVWAKQLLPGGEHTAHREPLTSTEADRRAFAADFEHGERPVTRRKLLLTLMTAAAASIGVAALFPLRSLGPRPGRKPFTTAWGPGVRLVTETGAPVHVDQLEVGGVVTVFPEGDQSAGDSQTLLIRLEEGAISPSPGRQGWTPQGYVAYSKVCTHAGCPVGLYRQETEELLCPCHQSLFDVVDNARPRFGPATRPLPQLPLRVDDDGYLVARDDFPEPVGPGFWDMA